MKILVVGLNYKPEPIGIGKYTGEFVDYLVEHDDHVRMITAQPYYPYWEIQSGYRNIWKKEELTDNLEVFRCPLWIPKRVTGSRRVIHLASFALASIPALARNLLWKPDMVICVIPTLFSAPITLFYSLLTGSKTWLHIHDFEVDAAFNLDILRKRSFFYRVIKSAEARIIKSFDKTSTISNQMIIKLRKMGVDEDSLALIPNWVEVEDIYPTGNKEYRKTMNLGKDDFIVLYSGNLGKKQDFEFLIELAEELMIVEKIKFVICGEGNQKEFLEKKAKDKKNLFVFDLQPAENMNDFLNMADLHLLPQKSGISDLVLPSKLSNMLASGVPVMVSALPQTDLGEIVRKAGILIAPGGVKIAAAEIKKLSDGSGEMLDIGSQGRKWVLDHWEKKKVLKNFRKEMNSLMQ